MRTPRYPVPPLFSHPADPCTLSLTPKAAQTLARRSVTPSPRRAPAPPCQRCSAAPQPARAAAEDSPVHQEPPRGRHLRHRAPPHRNFARSSTQVSRSALEFPRRRCSLARTDPLSNLAAQPRIDPRGPVVRRSPATTWSRAQHRPPPLPIVSGAATSRPAGFEPSVRTPVPSRLLCARVRVP